LALLEKQEAEKQLLEKMLELEKQKMELEKQKNVQIAGQLAPGDSRVSEIGSSIGSRDQSEEISDKIIFQGKIISDADEQLRSSQKIKLIQTLVQNCCLMHCCLIMLMCIH